MALQNVTSAIKAGDAFSHSGNISDSFFVTPDVRLFSTGGHGINIAGDAKIQMYGEVFGAKSGILVDGDAEILVRGEVYGSDAGILVNGDADISIHGNVHSDGTGLDINASNDGSDSIRYVEIGPNGSIIAEGYAIDPGYNFDIVIENSGVLRGGKSSNALITAEDLYLDNDGAITALGANLFHGVQDAEVTNGPDGAMVGDMWAKGYFRIENSGYMRTTLVGGEDLLLYNGPSGIIDESLKQGSLFATAKESILIHNYGTINTRAGELVHGTYQTTEFDIANFGTMNGDIIINGGKQALVRNTGLIVGDVKSTIDKTTFDLSDGRVKGDVTTGSYNDTVMLNGATVWGDVETKNGNDPVSLRNGKVEGILGLGAGHDKIDLRGASVTEVRGGAGNDRYIINDDTIVIVDRRKDGGDDVIRSYVSFSLFDAQHVEDLELGGSRNLRGTGDHGENSIFGNSGDNVLTGHGADDFLFGLAGDDTLGGGTHNDVLEGGFGDDVLRGGRGDDSLLGEQGDDKLIGHSGADTMNGGDSNDTLIGGHGRDDMTGGDDDDVFKFNKWQKMGTSSANRPIIRDFVQGDDLIDLSQIRGPVNPLVTFPLSYVGVNLGFILTPGEVRVDTNLISQRTLIEGDIDGDANADFQIELQGTIFLQQEDFIL